MPQRLSGAFGAAMPIFVIKNTFVSVLEDDADDEGEESPAAKRRSKSWSPRSPARGAGEHASGEEISTTAPRRGRDHKEDGPLSDASTDCSDVGEPESPALREAAPPPPPMPISLHDILQDQDQEDSAGACAARRPRAAGARTPLRRCGLSTKAGLFQPKLAAPPACIAEVVSAVTEAVEQLPIVSRVQLLNGPMGGVTSIVAEVPLACAGAQHGLLDVAKEVLRVAAERSEAAHLMGSNSQKPFQAFGNAGFSAAVAHLPLEQQHLACWDLIRNGVCPRRGCRWCHTGALDQIQVVVTVKLV